MGLFDFIKKKKNADNDINENIQENITENITADKGSIYPRIATVCIGSLPMDEK